MQKNLLKVLPFFLIGVDQAVQFFLLKNHASWVRHDRYFDFFTPLFSLALAVVIFWLLRKYFIGVGAGLWLGAGLVGNLFSYLLHGYFVDYLPTGLSYLNIADVVIIIGLGLAVKEYTKH